MSEPKPLSDAEVLAWYLEKLPMPWLFSRETHAQIMRAIRDLQARLATQSQPPIDEIARAVAEEVVSLHVDRRPWTIEENARDATIIIRTAMNQATASLQARNAELEGEVAKLGKFAWHYTNCTIWFHSDCSCGLGTKYPTTQKKAALHPKPEEPTDD